MSAIAQPKIWFQQLKYAKEASSRRQLADICHDQITSVVNVTSDPRSLLSFITQTQKLQHK